MKHLAGARLLLAGFGALTILAGYLGWNEPDDLKLTDQSDRAEPPVTSIQAPVLRPVEPDALTLKVKSISVTHATQSDLLVPVLPSTQLILENGAVSLETLIQNFEQEKLQAQASALKNPFESPPNQ